MKEIGIIVTGATGRMGAKIIQHVRDSQGVRLVGSTDRPGSSHIGLDTGLAAGISVLELPVSADLSAAIDSAPLKAQVVVDFTNAEASANHAEICAARGISLVVGSTGFDEGTEGALKAASKEVAIVVSPNMSASVNLMIELCRRAAEVLGSEYEVEILEAHHRAKKDAPSGTALRLGEEIASAGEHSFGEVAVFGRRGSVGERTRSEIGVHAMRGADVVGEHTVYFFGEGDRLEIAHRATSRDTFARGAVRAATWVVDQPPGLYGMREVLGFGG